MQICKKIKTVSTKLNTEKSFQKITQTKNNYFLYLKPKKIKPKKAEKTVQNKIS